MPQQLGARLDHIGEEILKGPRNARVQLPPLCAQQRAVGRVLHQRMLEQKAGPWRLARPEDETGGDKTVQRLP
jgi:hypothetical protein